MVQKNTMSIRYIISILLQLHYCESDCMIVKINLADKFIEGFEREQISMNLAFFDKVLKPLTLLSIFSKRHWRCFEKNRQSIITCFSSCTALHLHKSQTRLSTGILIGR